MKAETEPSLAVLGGGCFWCLEAVFQKLKGVEEVTSGYAGGEHPAPTYREVCAGTTGHAEVVRIIFDPGVIPYRTLLEVFFATHDPTTPNRQGADAGPQYRSIILYDGMEQEKIARGVIRDLEADGHWDAPVVTELSALGTFFPAEREHHDYYRRNPSQPYCAIVVSPKVAKARRAFQELYCD
ncbi:MAG: peptide-methionine (S)-S-oxide reductase [Gemmatimonadetes bacterium]|nr:peptide-methionine (S)-S-oxide reductase [Gemmatimonadota bacterium]